MLTYVIVGVLSALIALIIAAVVFAFLLHNGHIVFVNPVTGQPQPRPLPPGAAVAPISRAVPAAAPSTTLGNVRVDLLMPGGRAPLLFTADLPVEGLASAPATIMAPDVRDLDTAMLPEDGLPPFSPGIISGLSPGGCLLVGRQGHVRPNMGGFEVMSRILFEVVIKDGRFYISAKRGMQDAARIQIKMADGSMTMTSSSEPLMITGPTEVRQEMVGRTSKHTSWYFRISPCN